MTGDTDPLAADREFFASLIKSDAPALDQLLSDEFMLIDVMSGSEITKPVLLSAIASGQLKFESIEPAENRVREYGTVAVVTGRTRMRGEFTGVPFAVSSRYTHVFIAQHGRWCLVAAQGTQIAT